MTKYKLLTTISACALALSYQAFAQSTVTISKPDADITIEGEINQEPQLIPIQIITDPKTGLTTAKLTQLQQSGSNMGLNKLMMEGVVTEKEVGATKKEINIVWNTASMIDEDSGEKKTTPFGIPFTSKVLVSPQLDQGDEFNAEGDPMELIAAWERLTKKENKEEEEDEEEEDTTPDEKNAASSGGGTGAEERDTGFESPEFTSDPTSEPNVTTEVCGVRVDLPQLAAIVQERVLVDGVEESGCEDTLTRYPLTKKYNQCPLIFDTEEMKAYQQFTLIYTDPEDGEVQAQSCTQDDENPIALILSNGNCGIRHDFGQGLSIQQESITYEHQGAVQTLQDCQDGSVTYAHELTRDGCTPIVANGEITFQEKTIITVDGSIMEILACQPDPDSTTAVEEEECTGNNRYTHDFDGNQSFLNKTYYYIDEGQRVDVSTCIASDTVWSHQQDEAACSPSHDDTAKVTTMKAKDYFEESAGNKVYVSSCDSIAPTIPYVSVGDKWRIASSNNTVIIPSGSDSSNYNDLIRNHNAPYGQRFFSNEKRMYEGCLPKPMGVSGGKRPCLPLTTAANSDGHWPSDNRFAGQRWCITGELSNNWTVGGVTINQTYSTDEPTVSQSFSPIPPNYIPSGSLRVYNGNTYAQGNPQTFSFNCPQPTCLHTHLVANPTWQRGDMSQYIDTATTSANMHVCGDGSNLNGQNR